jgi:hypothetical protein
MSNSRYCWHCFWKKYDKRHPNCPLKRYPKLVEYWKSPEAEEESKRMRRVRTRRGTEVSTSVETIERSTANVDWNHANSDNLNDIVSYTLLLYFLMFVCMKRTEELEFLKMMDAAVLCPRSEGRKDG